MLSTSLPVQLTNGCQSKHGLTHEFYMYNENKEESELLTEEKDRDSNRETEPETKIS